VTHDQVDTMEGWTPGPWGWFGSAKRGIYLATVKGGRRFVMGFKRQGMNGAEPTFQVDRRMVPASTIAVYEVCRDATSADDPRVYRDDIVGLRSADATLIVAAPDLYAAADEAHAFMSIVMPTERTAEAHAIVAKLRAALSKARGQST
jgi:hypothetical protein